MPDPHPGQQWKHGWIPMTGGAGKSKNHGRKPGPNSAITRLVKEAAAVHNRMKAQDARRGKNKGSNKPATPRKSSSPQAPKAKTSAPPPAAKKAPERKAPAPKPTKAEPKGSASAVKPSWPKGKPAAKKAGVDSHGKALREGDEVTVTGGAGQGKTGKVVGKGPGGQVKVDVGGREVTVHTMNVRNRQDHEDAKAGSAATRKPAARKDSGTPTSNASIPQIQSQVRDAYKKLAPEDGAWVGFAQLRRQLGKDLPRNRVDEALRHMISQPGVHITPESNQKALTDAQRAAEVIIGDQRKHYIMITR